MQSLKPLKPLKQQSYQVYAIYQAYATTMPYCITIQCPITPCKALHWPLCPKPCTAIPIFIFTPLRNRPIVGTLTACFKAFKVGIVLATCACLYISTISLHFFTLLILVFLRHWRIVITMPRQTATPPRHRLASQQVVK